MITGSPLWPPFFSCSREVFLVEGFGADFLAFFLTDFIEVAPLKVLAIILTSKTNSLFTATCVSHSGCSTDFTRGSERRLSIAGLSRTIVGG